MSGATARDTIYCSECRRKPSEDEDAMNRWRTHVAHKVLYVFCPKCWADQGQKSTAA